MFGLRKCRDFRFLFHELGWVGFDVQMTWNVSCKEKSPSSSSFVFNLNQIKMKSAVIVIIQVFLEILFFV